MAQIIYAEPKKKQKAKQPTTICSLGPGDRLRSSIEQFNKIFVGKQVLKCAFSLSGKSDRDKRCVFSTILRHLYHNSEAQANTAWNKDEDTLATGYGNMPLDILAPRRLVDPLHTLKFNGIDVKTDEIRLNEEYNGEELDGGNIREFWSPYSLQVMEDISWNLNRRKCLPYGVSVSQQNDWTYNDHLTPHTGQPVYGEGVQNYQGGYQFKKFHADADGDAQPDEWALSDKLVCEPLLTDVDVHTGIGQGESSCRQLLKALNARVDKTLTYNKANKTPVNAVGRYHTQISNGVCYYTFSNTSDVDEIVDMVVHKIKDKMGVSEKANSTITDRILQHYGENWMDARVRHHNQDLYAFIDETRGFKADDVFMNPKVKFLPASLRLGRAEQDMQMVGTDVVINYSTEEELPYPTQGVEFNTRKVDFGNNPPFVDVYRQQVIVQAGKRKTIALRLPAKSYDPTKAVCSSGFREAHSVLLNEHGYHVTFGVCGKKARTIIEPSNAPSDIIAQAGAKVIGVHHAPSSFKVVGRYYESIIPAVCVDPDVYTECDMKIDLDVAEYVDDPRVQSATFADASNRDIQGRYQRLLVDGQATRSAAARSMAQYIHESTTKAATAENLEVDSDELKEEMNDANTQSVSAMLTAKAVTDLPSGTSDEQAKLAEQYGYEMMTNLDNQVSSFKRAAAYIGDVVPAAKAWYDGSPVTISTISDFGTWLVANKTGSEAKAAQELSGINFDNLAKVWEEQKASLPALYSDFNNATVKFINSSTKHRRLTANDGAEVVVVDHDPSSTGVQDADNDVNITNDPVPVAFDTLKELDMSTHYSVSGTTYTQGNNSISLAQQASVNFSSQAVGEQYFNTALRVGLLANPNATVINLNQGTLNGVSFPHNRYVFKGINWS